MEDRPSLREKSEKREVRSFLRDGGSNENET